MNHHYEIDWLLGWMAADRLRCLGNARVFAKKMLRMVPVIGWAWNFSDVIYVERSCVNSCADETCKVCNHASRVDVDLVCVFIYV
mgnify:CR=1 FL=1